MSQQKAHKLSASPLQLMGKLSKSNVHSCQLPFARMN